MSEGVAEAAQRFHPMVLAAQARLAAHGGWQRLLAGEVLDGQDELDAELLVAAGVLDVDECGYALGPSDAVHRDSQSLADGNIAYLRRALRYAEHGQVGWSGRDLDVVRAQGRASAAAADMMVEQLARMPGSRAALESGEARFLDVGVGVGAISARVCELYPGVSAVGLDVLPEVLSVAAEEVARAGLGRRVELRHLDVADLADEEAYDLAWLPQPFVARPSFERGLTRVRVALRHDRWVVVPVSVPLGDTAFERALSRHSAHVLGGGPITQDEAEGLVRRSGFTDVAWCTYQGLVLLLARRP
jgi:SAM-dependent methyltransferase